MELSQRVLDVPFGSELASWGEQAARANLFWTPPLQTTDKPPLAIDRLFIATISVSF